MQKVTEDGRSLGFLAWHLVTTLQEMPSHTGLQIDAPTPETATPETVAEIVSAFEKGAKSMSEEVGKNWTDEDFITGGQSMYGETWTRGETLGYLLVHQTHHRGQITVLMRQAGLPVTGIYGPAREEWQALRNARDGLSLNEKFRENGARLVALCLSFLLGIRHAKHKKLKCLFHFLLGK